MTRRRSTLLRGMTLVEVMVVGAVSVTLAAAGGSTLVEQVRRTRSIEGARNALLPHTVARDRAVAARTCVESVLVPPLSQAYFSLDPELPAAVVNGQSNKPRIAVIQWSECGSSAVATKIDFYDLDGEVEFDAYSTPDGRMVFGIDGALTNDRPAAAAGGVVVPPTCGAPPSNAGGSPALPPKNGAPPGQCLPPPPMPAPPADVSFSARTYYGEVHGFKTYSRMGGTEAQTPTL